MVAPSYQLSFTFCLEARQEDIKYYHTFYCLFTSIIARVLIDMLSKSVRSILHQPFDMSFGRNRYRAVALNLLVCVAIVFVIYADAAPVKQVRAMLHLRAVKVYHEARVKLPLFWSSSTWLYFWSVDLDNLTLPELKITLSSILYRFICRMSRLAQSGSAQKML